MIVHGWPAPEFFLPRAIQLLRAIQKYLLSISQLLPHRAHIISDGGWLKRVLVGLEKSRTMFQ